MATTESLLTAEEFFELPDDGKVTELVKGQIVKMTPSGYRHGKLCLRIGRWLGNFVEEHDLGSVIGNDAGVITTRKPDSVRGADVAYYSYARQPKNDDPIGYTKRPPELVVEVTSPTDRRSEIEAKVAEYLAARVDVVCVVHDDRATVVVHRLGVAPTTLQHTDVLTFPDILPGFAMPLQRLFEA